MSEYGDAAAVAPRLAEIVGSANVITDPRQLRTYECDGLTAHRCTPAIAVLPETAEQVAAIVRACTDAPAAICGARLGDRTVRWGAAPR